MISEVQGVSAAVSGAGASNVSVLDNIDGKAVAIGSVTYDTLAEAWTNIKSGDVIVLLRNCETSKTLYVPENVKITLDLNNHNITSTSRVFYVNEGDSALEVKGEGKISTTEQTVFGMVGSATDDGKTYTLTIGHDVEISSSIYGIAIFDRDNSKNSYGVDVTFEGHDKSRFGSVYVNGNVQPKVGNIPNIKFVNAISDSQIYLAGFAKFSAVNCVFNSKGSLNIKAGEIRLSNNVFNIDCTDLNLCGADYVKNGNGAFGAKCGILFENGVPGYSGLTFVNVTADNSFVFNNSNGTQYTDVMYIDYTESASVDIEIGVQYLGIGEFKYKIAYSGTLSKKGGIKCSGYIYFVNEEQAKSYTKEKFQEQYHIDEITSFGTVEENK